MADFDYGMLFQVVEDLLNGPKSEADLRTAANRAYYSVYGTLRKKLITDAPPDRFGTAGRHTDLLKACIKHPDLNLQTIGKGLESLKFLRDDADYHPLVDVPEPSVVRAKHKASILLMKIRLIGIKELRELHAAI